MFKEFYGEFYRILDACADSAYQALFSAYEKEPGVEAMLHRDGKLSLPVNESIIQRVEEAAITRLRSETLGSPNSSW